MKKFLIFVTASIVLLGCSVFESQQQKQPRKVALQTYSLHQYTLEETIQKVKPLGLDGIECYPQQAVSKSMPNVYMNIHMNQQQRDFVKKLLKDANLKIVSFGVTAAKDEKEIEEHCKLAVEFGFKTIVTEAPEKMFPLWEKYCQKYDLQMCLHHHAKDAANKYYDADYVMSQIKDFKHIKANPDVGHLSRSGYNPIESLKKLKGHIGSVHFKDQREYNKPKDDCVVLGTGALNNKGMLQELDSQGYTGFYVIEHEANVPNKIDEIKQCINFMRNN